MQPRGYRRGLAIKIIVWSFVPTIMILLGVVLVTFVAYQQVTEDLVIERDKQVTRLSASQLSNELDNYTQILTEVARSEGLRRGNKERRFETLQDAANRLVVFDGGVLVLDTYGEVIAALPGRLETVGRPICPDDEIRLVFLLSCQLATQNVRFKTVFAPERLVNVEQVKRRDIFS